MPPLSTPPTSPTAASDSPVDRSCPIARVALGVLFLACALRAIALRGAWYDEFYTYYLVRPEAPLAQLAPAWLRDNHPPLFYALAWAWGRLIALFDPAPGIPVLRALNLVIGAGALAGLVHMARTDRWFGRIAPFYAAALAGSFSAIDRIDQLRSYFTSFALAALILPMLARVLVDERPGGRRDLWLLAVLSAALSLHLVTSVILAGVVAGVVVVLVPGRRIGAMLRLSGLSVVAAVPLVAAMAIQLGTIESNTRAFWIPSGINAGRWAIEQEFREALLANPLLAPIAAGGLALILLRSWQDRGKPAAPVHADRRVILALGGGLILALAVLMAIHLRRPILITRYLVAVDPVVALVVALAAERAVTVILPRRRALAELAVLATSAVMLFINLPATLAQPSWNGTARAIAAIVRSCPETAVHPDMAWNTIPRDTPPRDNRDVVPFAYRHVATVYGFRLADPGVVSDHCPNLFWTEHVSDLHPDARTVLQRLIRAGYPLQSGRKLRIGSGWVLVSPPVPARATRP